MTASFRTQAQSRSSKTASPSASLGTKLLQRRAKPLALNEPGDAHEQEADRTDRTVENGTPPVNGFSFSRVSVLGPQRKCACGRAAGPTGECAACVKKRALGLQPKLAVNQPGDAYEQEANRVADQVLTASAHPAVSGAPMRIQRLTGQTTEGKNTAPASVDRVIASSGTPLKPALRQDMEQRFGHDFSGVRVRSGAAAEQSARDVNANAYTLGHDIVCSAVGYAPPGTREGQRPIAHELTHVVQQSDAESVLFRQGNEASPLIVNIPSQMERSQFDGGRTLRRKALGDAPYAEPTVRVPMDSPGNPNEVAADFVASEAAIRGSPAGDQLTSPTDGAAPSDGGADLPASLAAEIIRPSGGTVLPPGLRVEQETRLGCALSHVRIHQGTRAAALADTLDARAFTYGSEIWLGAGETLADRRLMTHELTHVVQQVPCPLPDAAAKGGEPDAGTRLQATRRYYYALPTLGKGSKVPGDRSHDQVQEILGKDTKNQPIFSEVPIPEGASTGSTGRADFLKTDTGAYFGVKFTGNSPAYLSLSEKSLLNGVKASDATHRKNAAPAGNTGIEGGKACASSGLPLAQGICRIDKGPKSVSIADLKPNYEAEVLLGGAQVDRYVAKVNELSTKVNNFATTSPTLIHPAGKTWSVSAQRMPKNDLDIPQKFESPTASSPRVAVNLYVNGTQTRITDEAVLHIAKHSDGFITYEYLPLRMLGTGTAAGGAATATSPIADGKAKLGPVKTKLKEEPKRVSTMPRRSNARPRLARKRDKLEAKDDFNFSTWKKSTFEPWQATAKTATGGEGKKALTDPSTEAEQRMKDEAVLQIDARTSFATKSAPKGTAERTRELEVVQHWVDHGEKYGRLRQIFGSAFVKVVKVYDSVKAKIEAKVDAVKQRMKRANSGSGGIKGAVLAALRGIAGSLLGVFIRDIGNRLVTAVQKGATVLLGSLFGEEVEKIEEQLAAIEKAEADFKVLIAETLEDKFADQLKTLDEKLKQIESIAATISNIGTLVNLVKWAYRIAQCFAPPLLGCLIALVGTALAEAIIAAIVASCWFQREIAYPIVSVLGPIKKLPGLASEAIANRVRDLLPPSIKPLMGEVDMSDLDSKPTDVDCDNTSQYNMDPNQRKLAEMLKQYDPDHVESLMKALGHLGVATNPPDPGAKLEGAEIDALKKLLDKYSKQQLDDMVAKTPPKPPRMGGAGDFIADLDNEVQTQGGGTQTGQPVLQGGPAPSGGPPPTAEEIAKESADVAERLKKSKTKVKPDQGIFAQPEGKKGDVVTVFMLRRWGRGPITGGVQRLTITDVAADGSITATVHAGTRYYNADGVYVETSTQQTAAVFKPVGGSKKK